MDEGRWEEEGWRLRKDGARFWAAVVITALFDEEHNLLGFAKVTRDLTERKRAEDERLQLLTLEREARAETEASMARLSAVQKVTESALTHLNLDDLLVTLLERIAEILVVDSAAVLLLNKLGETLEARATWGQEEIEPGGTVALGEGFAGRIAAEGHYTILNDPEPADVQNPMPEAKQGQSMLGVPLIVEGDVIGVLQVGALHHRRFTDSDAQFLQIVADRVAMAIDHARLVEAARTAREETEFAAATLRARDEFLSLAAHELKTPMTSLRIATHFLLRRTRNDMAPTVQELQRAVTTIDQQVERLARLINQLVESVQLQSNSKELEPGAVNIAGLVRTTADVMQRRSDRHHLVVNGPERVTAHVDPHAFELVVHNLLDNAVRFSPGGGAIDIEVTHVDQSIARLRVRDWGIGIPPERRSHLFERFHQGHDAEHRSGFGLGLYVAREIVERLGGTISADFPADGGSQFVIEVPAEEPARMGAVS